MKPIKTSNSLDTKPKKRKISIRKRILAMFILVAGLLIVPLAAAADETISGTFTVLNGANAPVTTLTAVSTIIDVTSEANSYCIWGGPGVMPGQVYRALLCGGRDRPSLVGTVLQPGNYWVLAQNNDTSICPLSVEAGGYEKAPFLRCN